MEESTLLPPTLRHNHERTRPLLLEVRDMKPAVALRELEAQQRMRVVPAHNLPPAAADPLSHFPEALAEGGQILAGRQRVIGPVSGLDVNVGQSRPAAAEQPAGQEAVAALFFVEGVITGFAKHILLDEQVVPTGPLDLVSASPARHPQDGSAHRALGSRRAGALGIPPLAPLDRRRAGQPFGEAGEQSWDTPLCHGSWVGSRYVYADTPTSLVT